MATQSGDRSSDWEFYREQNVIVGDFPEGTKLSGEESDMMVERFGELMAHPRTNAHVTILRSAEPYSREGQENLEKSAQAGLEEGITRWAVVAEGTKQMTMESRVSLDGITVETFGLDEVDEAIDWAREG